MFGFLIAVLIILLVVVVYMYIIPIKNVAFNEDEEVETVETTTVTTETPTYTTVGELKRKKARNGQLYVIDPVDGDKVFVNAHDDLYEDGGSKIWKLI